MSRIVVIADDLTGAADAGVMFCPYFQPVLLVDHGLTFQAAVTRNPQVLAVHTDSRALRTDAARARVQSLLASMFNHPPEWMFKKIDSSLRGNIGTEADTIIEGTDFACSFISAAFPAMGRTTVGGIHTVHGVPVAETELSRDPVTPVTESRITTLVAGQSHYPVGHVGLEVIEGGLSCLKDEVDRLRSQGCVHLTFDATRQDHLAQIVALASSRREKVLLVGTAGLAQAAASHWGKGLGKSEPDRVASQAGQLLFVCGTAAQQTAQQITALQAFCTCTVVELDAGLLAGTERRQELGRKAQELQGLFAGQDMVLKVAPGPHALPDEWQWGAEKVACGLGLLTADLVRTLRPQAIFCCGGDTAAAVMAELGAWGSELIREVVPGMVLGILQGGILDGVTLVTKPGSFGTDEDLVALHRYFKAKRKGQDHL